MSLLCKRNSKGQRAFTGHRPEKITCLEGKIIIEIQK